MVDLTKPHIEVAEGNPKKLSDKHLAMVRRGAELTRSIKDQKAELEKINAGLKEEIGPGVSIILPAEVRVPISVSEIVSIGNPDALKEHLGTRAFNREVNQQITFKTTDTLLNMAVNDDKIEECLTRKVSKSVKYLPIKTQK